MPDHEPAPRRAVDPAPPPAGPPGAYLRVSDAERDQVAEVLREAAAEGRLDLEELRERLDLTYAARTYADLAPLTADLPALPDQPVGTPAPTRRPVPAVPGPSPASTVAVMSDSKRRGPWRPPSPHRAVAFWGSVTLDLREATWDGDLVVEAFAIMAGVEVVVDAWTAVTVSGVGVMGEFSQGRDKVPAEIGPSSPSVTVRGLALMGSVTVRRRGPAGGSALDRWRGRDRPR